MRASKKLPKRRPKSKQRKRSRRKRLKRRRLKPPLIKKKVTVMMKKKAVAEAIAKVIVRLIRSLLPRNQLRRLILPIS